MLSTRSLIQQVVQKVRQEKAHCKFGDSMVEVGKMVSRSDPNVNNEADTDTLSRSHPRYTKWKVAYDITPITGYLKNLGENSNLSPEQLTQKPCWLMAMCGFMRPSNTGRVGDIKTPVTDSYVRFAVFSPKEKRGGSTVEKVCHIHMHSVEYLFRVKAYLEYKKPLSREIPCRGLGAYIVYILILLLTKVSRSVTENLRSRIISNDSESQTAISGLGRRVGQLDAGQTENAEYQGTKPDQSPHVRLAS
ncbi:hypothetical protein BB560_005197 [Smittium megazygosporum]|uniref:Uncharacterized protein n=1 Tax=Smittium megazygosporum TaxID=133381 RepID=A0A2T9Z739_9FUNG|nr:hypothetical protein BB560_005197 [Smittium megazygosporum]